MVCAGVVCLVLRFAGLVGVENCVQDAALVQAQFDLLFRDRTGLCFAALDFLLSMLDIEGVCSRGAAWLIPSAGCWH